MGYRDDRLATRAQVSELERELAETKDALAQAREASAATAARHRASKLWPAAAALAGSLALFSAASYAGFSSSGSSGEQLGIGLGMAGAVVLTLAVFLLVMARFVVVVPPNQLAVVSGRKTILPDGSSVGYRLVRSGRVVRLPVIEVVSFMDLTNLVVPVRVCDCYSKGGTPAELEAVANLKVAGEMPLAANAVERFLSLDREAIAAVAARTLEGILRTVIAEFSVDDVKARPSEFAERVVEEAERDFSKLGLVLDTIKIGKISSP